MKTLAIGCISNSQDVLHRNLMISPLVRDRGVPVLIENNPQSAASGYNRILERTEAPVVVLAHQDIYLPGAWEQLLQRRIAEVEALDPGWGVIAAFGIGNDGAEWGPIWSTSIGRIVGGVSSSPIPIQSADEALIVLRRRPGLVFDETLPHFHFYGSDIVQTSRKLGHGAWNAALPLVHNDGFKGSLDEHYDRGFHYIRKKWRAELPINTPTVKIAWHGAHLRRVKRAMKESFDHRSSVAQSAPDDPQRIAELCGWETPV
ncbi:MAG: hypothetical protein SYC29_18135 [Planctomycetota bacterium]|nr:hypothetical protein [Planctomycetota bacterium]